MNLTEAVLELNRLQFENDSGGKNDLFPAQFRVFALLPRENLRGGLIRRWIECHPEVAPLRNRLDDWDNYGDDAASGLERAGRMEKDVLELMARRNAAARELGYVDFPQAALAADGLSAQTLDKSLNEFLRDNLAQVAGEARAENVSMDGWFSWLNRRGRLEKPQDPMGLLEEFAQHMGLDGMTSKIAVHINDGGCFAGRTGSDSFEMQVAPVDTVGGWRTLFHEFGHLCTYAAVPGEELPYMSPVVDEMLAVLFENAAVRLLADADLQKRLLWDMRADYTRAAVSARFETALWKDPERAAELYAEEYGKLIGAPQSGIWALDSFRSIDCMTITGYALGQHLADGMPGGWWERLGGVSRTAARTGVDELMKMF
jgi:hypothetical protein